MPEIRNSVDQRRAAVDRFFAAFEDDLRRNGAIVNSYRRRHGRRLGPYAKLTVRHLGRQRAVYLGGHAQLIDEVRQRLTELQHTRRRHQAIESACRRIRRQGRLARRQLQDELVQLGLVLKGHEIRQGVHL